MSGTGVVVALRFEARCLGAPRRAMSGLAASTEDSAPHAPQAILSRLPDGSLIGISGMGDEAAAYAARALLRAGATALLSFGVAGALDPTLRAGTLVLATAVAREPGASGSTARFSTTDAWRKRLERALAGRLEHRPALLLSTAQPVAEPAQKRTLFDSTHAAAVDMESAAVGEVAAEAGVPFMAVRAIIDTAADRLPDSVLQAMHLGASDVELPGLLRLALRLGDWSALLRLARRRRRARRALRRCVRLSAPTRVNDATDPDRAGSG